MKAKASKLRAAVGAGKIAAVRELLDSGADPKVTNSLGESLLNDTLKPEIAQLLLEAGANPDFVPRWWNPPLHVAAANGRVAVAKVLLAYGAKPDLRNDEGNTPLHLAAGNGQTEFVRLLLAAGAKVGLANAEGKKPIHRICSSHSQAAPKIVQLLLAAGADPNSKDAEGSTPLMDACYFRNLPVVRSLLKSGAEVNTKDKFGWTAILSAIRREDAKAVALLAKSGAELSIRISKRHPNRSVAGRTLLEIAEDSSKPVRDLLAKLAGARTIAAQLRFLVV